MATETASIRKIDQKMYIDREVDTLIVMSDKDKRFTRYLAFTTILFFIANMLIVVDFSSTSKAAQHSTLSFSDPLSVKIIQPGRDQNTEIGSNLEITGTSAYNLDYTCHVSVIINDVKPYQKTTPTGTATKNDYSTWKYVVDSDYTTINKGENKITARLLCPDDQGEGLKKWYSVNVIGQSLPPTTTIAIPASESTGIPTPTNIIIDRDVLIELVNNRIQNNTEVIRDAIENSIMSLYARKT